MIRAYNEGKHIGRLLEGLSQQTVRPDEIIVVDSGSTDDTVDIALRNGCEVVRIEKDEFSFGRALNLGCEAATGEILLILSAHVYPVYDTFVEHMVSAFDRPKVAIAYGRQVGDHRTKFSESRVMLKWFPTENIWDQGHPFSNNANAAVLRSIWATTKYDETLTGLEDLDFARRVLESGRAVAYVADSPVVHVHEETWSVVRNRYRREAIAYAKIVPGAKLSMAKAVVLALQNIIGDCRDALVARQLRRNLTGIVRFRIAQFQGAWEGFRLKDHLTRGLLERFYYPPETAAAGAAATLGNPIVYQNNGGLLD